MQKITALQSYFTQLLQLKKSISTAMDKEDSDGVGRTIELLKSVTFIKLKWIN